MRNLLLTLLVATFAVACISYSAAENVPQIRDAVFPEAEIHFIGGDNQIRRLKGSHEATTKKEWWVSDENEEERGLPGTESVSTFFSKLKGRAKAKLLTKANGSTAKVDKLTDTQVKQVAAATADVVKKDRRIWPYVKKFLKILYGATLAALIIVSVDAMLY
ncbi:unnamed protein product [Phytophthora fragariaefolia]|uniref:Unnamed protein product n=1 Tax=Phytophthora fragariaefolia TaxID=1490495 RepID=A0A9W6Y9R2_9STRA|nr:unnamed protein product [Phytophthora fragariaefolia]